MSNDKIWQELWVQTVPGPSQFIKKIAQKIGDYESVTLVLPGYLPWGEKIREVIDKEITLALLGAPIRFEELDFSILPMEENQDVVSFLFEKYTPLKEKSVYRGTTTQQMVDFLIKRNVLKHTFFWIRGLTTEQEKDWIAFISKMPKSVDNSGIFLVETTQKRNYRTEIVYEEYLTPYDMQFFANSLLREYYPNLGVLWSQYITSVISALCIGDPELICALSFEALRFQKEEPLEVISTFTTDPNYKNRLSNENHILTKLANGAKNDEKSKEIHSDIWKVQVQVAFPVLEMERLQIIKTHKKGFVALLDHEVIRVEQFGTLITDCVDLELGSIVHYILNASDSMGERLLPISKRDDQWIRLLRKIRNKLAHNNCLTPEELMQLFR